MKIPVWLRRLLNFRRPTTSPVVQPEIARQETTYSSDQPIRTATDDRFARAVFATRVADTIIARKDSSSLVLGLYGAWGDGKTSVLYMIEERLRLNDALIPLRFNPWHFASEDQLIRGFFDTLATAIGENLKTRGEQIGEALDKYGTLLTVASASISGGATEHQSRPGGKGLWAFDVHGRVGYAQGAYRSDAIRIGNAGGCTHRRYRSARQD